MNEAEARLILNQELERYRSRSYQELVKLIDQSRTDQRTSPSGTIYQVEIEVFWDGGPGGDLRVGGSIDDGSLRYASSPLCDDFIMAPDGSFIGE